ncbi:MAG: aromatic ring-opening dioxygenase subunit LigB [Chloroflexi bacterium]|nr:MAG: aromatic ring-opening dioxygenase subunit LigB [Chloroflexota bacterium]TMD55710.1 MAG: aromatic ring-opening dioxygenase subunit LigB [Chloroflexota bacterium]
MSGLVFAAIAPHGTSAVPGATGAEEDARGVTTQASMAELERRFRAAGPQSVIVLTPHNVHVEGAMAVVTAGGLAGDLAQWDAPGIALKAPVDRELADGVKAGIRAAGIPVVGISFGGNNPHEAVHPMDWAVLIPLLFMGGRTDPQTPVVVVSPARDLTPEAHVEAGKAIAEAAAASGKRVALVASCDHGHGHLKDGPYGFREESKIFDDRVVEVLKADRLAELVQFDPELVQAAAADSWWQMLMLSGALGSGWKGEFLSYEHPTYYGMICAAYAPAEAATRWGG